jgi:hypothetical protein
MRFLCSKKVAALLGVSVSALEKGRVGVGHIKPPFHRFGKTVRYLESEVLEWATSVGKGGRRG